MKVIRKIKCFLGFHKSTKVKRYTIESSKIKRVAHSYQFEHCCHCEKRINKKLLNSYKVYSFIELSIIIENCKSLMHLEEVINHFERYSEFFSDKELYMLRCITANKYRHY